jgi:nicotinate-nucleotide pyrophosphorylase (carboxylating)
MGLFDMAMIKDNHIIAAGSIAKAVSDVRNTNPDITIEVETTGIEEVQQALSAKADIIMLDNMDIEEMKQAVEIIGAKAESEASGNITLETVKDVAATGVDYISVGALTHSVKAFDISQRLTYFNNHTK